MSELWTIAIPILLIDVANPVLLAVVILALTTERPYVTSLAVIAGHMVAYFAAGVLILFGLSELVVDILAPFAERLANPVPLDFVVSFLIGAALVVVAWRWKVAPPDPKDSQPEKVETGLVSAFLFGAFLNFVGIPFALPYFAFVKELYPLSDDARLWALLVYNLLYSLPFLLVPASMVLFGKAIVPALQRINQVVEKHSAYIIPGILGLLGLALVLDAGLYLVTGTPLF